jgi:hypothetical protein
VQGIPRVHAYIDDVVLSHNTHNEHINALKQVFERFRKYKMKVKLSKLQIGTGKINFLGYEVSGDNKTGTTIRPGELKVQAIKNWQPPTSVQEVRQFLGLCSFFRRTIPKFAIIAAPLTRLTRKDSAWSKGVLPLAALAAFRALRAALCARPCLAAPDFKKEFIVTVDSSGLGFGGILSQVGDDGIERPIAYASRSLSEKEKGAAAYATEAAGLVWCFRAFRPYLIGAPFRARTDHKPLLQLNRVQGQTLSRLYAELEEFLPYTLEYLPGPKMPADGLSRQGRQQQVATTEA